MLGRVEVGAVRPRPRVLGVEFRECEEVLCVGAHHPGSLAGSGLSCAWRKRSSDQGEASLRKGEEMEFLKRRNGLATAIQKENMDGSLALTRAETCIGPPKLWNLGVNQSGDLYRPPKTLEPSLRYE